MAFIDAHRDEFGVEPICTVLRSARGAGGPPAFDAETYKNRNVVERSFALVKQWRGIATRYDKLAITYRAGVILHP